MNADITIEMLLRGAQARDAGEWRQMKARCAWAKATVAALRAALKKMNERCGAAVGKLDEDAFERLCDAEQAKVDRFYKPLRAVIDHDRWPRELYFGCI